MFMMNHEIHMKPSQIMSEDILDFCPKYGCFHFLAKTETPLRSELQFHRHHGTVFCSPFFSQSRPPKVSKGVRNLHKDSRTLSVHQAEPLKTSCAPNPQGATSILWLQLHGRTWRINHGLRFDFWVEKLEMPSRQSSRAVALSSLPSQTSSECRLLWQLPLCESWSCTSQGERTCQTSSPPRCRSQSMSSRLCWCLPSSSQSHWPTHPKALPWSWPSDLSWPSLPPSLPSLQGPWWVQSEELSNTNSLSQITCMFMMNHEIHMKPSQIMSEDILDFCPKHGCFHFLAKTETPLRSELQFHRHHGTVLCSPFFSQSRPPKVSKGVRNLHKDSRTLGVHQAEPLKTSCAPNPQGATSILWLQLHGRTWRINHGLRFDFWVEKLEMPSRQSSRAVALSSLPSQTSSECRLLWQLPLCESWSCTSQGERTCQTSSPPRCRSQSMSSRLCWCLPSSSQSHWPTHPKALPWSWPSDLSWPSLPPSLPSLQGPWWVQSEELSNTNSLSQITCMFMMNHEIHMKPSQIMSEDILDFCPKHGCFHFLAKTETPLRSELQFHRHHGTVLCSPFVLAKQTTQSVQRSKKSPQGLKNS